MMLCRSFLWSLLKFLIRSRATIQALSRLTEAESGVGCSGHSEGGRGWESLPSQLLSLGRVPTGPAFRPSCCTAQLSNCVRLQERTDFASPGELWIMSKISVLSPNASMTQVPSQPGTKSTLGFPKPQARHTIPDCWATQPQPHRVPAPETVSALALLLT